MAGNSERVIGSNLIIHEVGETWLQPTATLDIKYQKRNMYDFHHLELGTQVYVSCAANILLV